VEEKRCKKCIYLVKAGNSNKILICSNRDDAKGTLFLAKGSDRPCRNFQTSRVIDRPKVKQPKNSKIRFIPLTRGKVAIVDAEDYEKLSKYKWYVSDKGCGFYACRQENNKKCYMHREIIQVRKGLVVDHIDHNGLNNRRNNLRACTVAENLWNCRGSNKSSRFKGVHRKKNKEKWIAQIRKNKKYVCIGHFDSEVKAAKAYDKMASKLFGEFVYLNFPEKSCR
jgi:hypothetical protein